ncbi:MAG: MarR family transcriptional regulator [Alphaproteobacteria bacterium]
MDLPVPIRTFVLHWGEMGTRWGVNRSVAQIHALLYLAERPLAADEIVAALGIARSNASNSLKELQAYRLVDLTHVPGDRRDHFTARHDPWDMLLAIVDERKRRELDPAIAIIRTCAAEAEADAAISAVARRRLADMQHFLEELDGFYDRIRRVPSGRLRRLLKLGDRIIGLLKS